MQTSTSKSVFEKNKTKVMHRITFRASNTANI